MCGIAGILGNFDNKSREKANSALYQFLKHRGKDGYGTYNDELISLSHMRLSIIDLSERGNQPLYNEDRSLVLICNGEIYNFAAIRKQLEQAGHIFYSNSDSEVILHLYEEYAGNFSKLLNSLTGMFAFALWDIKQKKLFIARDRLGIKPLYYYKQGNNLIFSSEVKPIFATGLANFTYDYTSVFEYFYTGSIPGPNTLYNEIKALPPGHYLVADNDKFNLYQYWDVPQTLGNWKNTDEVNEAVNHLLAEVVKDHLVADVPVGTFLSAGIDSSIITCFAAKFHPAIHTFTASFPGEPEDEGQIAEKTAGFLKTTHHALKLNSNFFLDFDTQFSFLDQPFANSSALSLGRISKLASNTIKVVLSGDGGDELFAGYFRHNTMKLPSFLKYIPGPIQHQVLELGAKITGKSSLKKLSDVLKLSEIEKYISKFAVTSEKHALSLFSSHIINQIDVGRYINRMESGYKHFEQNDIVNKLLYVDVKTTLVDEMLTKCDRMTMINNIEGRVPLLDHRMVELAFSIPSYYKQNSTMGKLPLRQIVQQQLGTDLAKREKSGFNSPLKKWLTEDDLTLNFAKEHLRGIKDIDFLSDKIKSEMIGLNKNSYYIDTFSLLCLNYFLENRQ